MTNSKPEWRQCPSLPNYEVSSEGEARRIGGSIRRIKVSKNGYRLLSIANGRGSASNISMARLICEAFNGPPPCEGMDCDHIDRNRSNDLPSNLRWLTRSENLAHRQNRFGHSHHASKLTSDIVRHIRSLPFRRGQDRQLAEQIGVSRETIRDVRLGKLWRHVDA